MVRSCRAVAAILLFWAGFVNNLWAETPYTISVRHSGDDFVGRQFFFELKEVIRESQGFKLSSGPEAEIRINLHTMDAEENQRYTVVTVVVSMRNHNKFQPDQPQTWYPIYLTSFTAAIGVTKVDVSATQTLALIDEAIEDYSEEERKYRDKAERQQNPAQ